MKIRQLTASRLLYSTLAVAALAALGWLLQPLPPQAPIRPAV
jgi:hypothetical protein